MSMIERGHASAGDQPASTLSTRLGAAAGRIDYSGSWIRAHRWSLQSGMAACRLLLTAAPGPYRSLALPGLIPLAIGLALVAGYYLSPPHQEARGTRQIEREERTAAGDGPRGNVPAGISLNQTPGSADDDADEEKVDRHGR